MNTKNKKLLTTTLTVAAFLLNTAPAFSADTCNKSGESSLVTTTTQQEALAKGLEGKCSCDDCK